MKRKDENEMKAPNEAVNDAPYYQFLTRPLIGNLQIAESIRRERHATAPAAIEMGARTNINSRHDFQPPPSER